MTVDRPSSPPPGWYPNSHGQTQWWDGTTWGPLAPHPGPNLYTRPTKDVGIAYLLAILLGGFAAHQFYLGNIAGAIAFLILWWGGWALSFVVIGIPMVIGAAIWWIVDLFLLPSMVRAANTRP